MVGKSPINMATIVTLDETFYLASSKFKIADLTPYQKLAIQKIVGRVNIFVNFPTGSEKSLIYQVLRLTFDHVSNVSCLPWLVLRMTK